MGSVLSAQKISAALDKAKNICIVEEPVEIGGVRLVVRNLRPADYENINKAIEGSTSEAEALFAWQKAHICYALVEVNGIDLRQVDFVEVEEVDAKGQKKAVKLELPTYLRDHLISTWSKEAIFTVYRKVGDAVSRAESASSEGIKFLVPEESPEEKYRQLVGEMRDIEDEISPAIIDRILEEHGLMKKSTAAEIKAAMEKEGQEAYEEIQRKKKEAEAAATEPPPAVDPCKSTTTSPLNPKSKLQCTLGQGHTGSHAASNLVWDDEETPSSDRRVPQPPPTPPETPESRSKRVPLNQMVVDLPQHPAAQPATVPARSRAAEIAALEGEAAAGLSQPPEGVEMPENVAVLTKKQVPVNPREAARAIDRPPAVGLNPKFRPPR